MADRIRNHRPRSPAKRVADRPGYFYAGEVARILALGAIDYAQLRGLLKLIRPQSEAPGRAWARYNIRDLACLRVAIELAGGIEALREGRRLHLRTLRHALDALLKAGYALPLLDLSLSREGTRIIARASGIRFDAQNGQLLLDLTQDDAKAFLSNQLLRPDFRPVYRAIATERRALHGRPRVTASVWNVAVVQ